MWSRRAVTSSLWQRSSRMEMSTHGSSTTQITTLWTTNSSLAKKVTWRLLEGRNLRYGMHMWETGLKLLNMAASPTSGRFLNSRMFINCIIWWKLACPHQGVVSMEGSKLAISFPKYHHTSEISGGKLVEVRHYHFWHCEIICNSCKVAKFPLLWFTDLHSN